MIHSPETHNWHISKDLVQSENGLVASQSQQASAIGAQILAAGGNAIDAAIATSFALGVAEPWMSGIGGGGYMIYRPAESTEAHVIEFGMRAPLELSLADYPLSNNVGGDLFAWPGVQDDVNIYGAQSVAIPGQIAGMDLAYRRYASLPWKDLVMPAAQLAAKGLPIDWYCQLIIGAEARNLARFEKSRETFLNDQYFPKSSAWTALETPRCDLSALAKTLELIANEGAETFYRGELARSIVADLQRQGGCQTLADFAQYQAREVQANRWSYHGHTLYSTPNLTAGPTLRHTFAELERHALRTSSTPDANAYAKYCKTMRAAMEQRLVSMGDEDGNRESCTTHFNVVDKQGNMVSVTQTLLSIFGSRLMLPESGVLMNNGIMWFDPRPGHANSLAAGKQCLSNMCPVLAQREDGTRFAVGAAGGRRIFPAVAQLLSFILDYQMDIHTAMMTPRIDVSHPSLNLVDNRLPAEIVAELQQTINPIKLAPRTIYPYNFACPSLIAHQGSSSAGITEIMSPWSSVCVG